ncbi:MAG: CRISPR system precrRNA processing endoribonuclease RAMP protein Cas6 [Leptospiraceae bacterium]|nr:CRISPR system precrRNA processing endoribonuclease RAMP protein Cas6 [Leptospiraceae bacterium]MCP5494127.1 CRISPR system precrRNA processing endoribonuclease RAMP protein Cas6 [Leptospiraceae bacterium]
MLKSELKFSKIIISLVATSECIFNGYTDLFIQNYFPHVLKETSCLKSDNLCDICSIPTCPYYQIIHDKNDKIEAGYLEYRPYPYIINASDKYLFFRGELLDINITIFGDYAKYLKNFISAFQKMGEIGFGDYKNKFQVSSVRDALTGDLLFGNNEIAQKQPKQMTILEYIGYKFGTTHINHGTNTENNQNVFARQILKNIQITFLTPTKLSNKIENIDAVKCDTLFEEAIERYTSLHLLYGDFRDEDTLGKNQVFTSNGDIEAKEKCRYIRPSQQNSDLLGILGTCRISNIDEKMFQLLKTLEILHIGKNASYGMGKVKIDNWILVK